MDVHNALALYKAFADDHLTFLYSGTFHDEHTARLINLGEEILGSEGAARSLRGKLAFVMVEAYQNIVRHRAQLPDGLYTHKGRSLFVLRSKGQANEVTAVNPVSKDDRDRLKVGLDRLEKLDVQQMKQVFLRGLQSEERTDRGGAGLGLIEMARRSGNPLRHAFAPLNEGFQLFALQVLVATITTWRSGSAFDDRVHAIVVEQGITMACRGHFSSAAQEILLNMVEHDLVDRQGDRCKRAFLLMMGVLAELDVLGSGPLIQFCVRNGATLLVAGVPLEKEQADRMERAVSEVNAIDLAGLQQRYRDILLGRKPEVGSIELGLMDLRRRSSGPIRAERSLLGELPFLYFEVLV